MNLEAVLAQLEGVRRNGAGHIARCPAHEDRTPSLSINEHEGKILVHCHAGCSQEAVLAALKELSPQNGVTARIVAVYDYQDEKGELLFQVLRYEPKNFK
jgi:DNA primase